MKNTKFINKNKNLKCFVKTKSILSKINVINNVYSNKITTNLCTLNIHNNLVTIVTQKRNLKKVKF